MLLGPNSVIDDRNPASPTLLTNKDALWERSSANTPTGSPMTLNHANVSPTITMGNLSRKPDLAKDAQHIVPVSSSSTAQASAEDLTNDLIPLNLTLDVPGPIPTDLDDHPHIHDLIERSPNPPERQASSREKKNGKKIP